MGSVDWGVSWRSRLRAIGWARLSRAVTAGPTRRVRGKRPSVSETVDVPLTVLTCGLLARSGVEAEQLGGGGQQERGERGYRLLRRCTRAQ